MSYQKLLATDIIKQHPIVDIPISIPAAPAKPLDLDLDAPPPRTRKRPFNKLQFGLFFAAVIVMIAGVLFFLRASQERQGLIQKAAAAGAPSTNKPAVAAVASYTVAANKPKYLNVPKLGIHARVLPLGVLSGGALAAPSNVFDVGWYTKSSLPGQPGAALIDGHVSSWTTKGVFYNLKKLTPGDKLTVILGDDKPVNYEIVKTQVFSADNVDMKAAMTPVVSGIPGLNLITCTGKVKPGTSEFNQRIVVFTEQI